jgi:hypothetical protein
LTADRISISNDKFGKVFDVVNFDMINILKLDYVPEAVAWIHQVQFSPPLSWLLQQNYIPELAKPLLS